MLLINGCNKITVIPNHMNSVDFIPTQKPNQNKTKSLCTVEFPLRKVAIKKKKRTLVICTNLCTSLPYQ